MPSLVRAADQPRSGWPRSPSPSCTASRSPSCCSSSPRRCAPLTQHLRSENHTREHYFTFEQIYAEDASQEAIFAELSTLIQSSLDGYNVCVFG